MKTSRPGRIQVKRVYDLPATTDGARWLVDRVWPRGLSKEAVQLDGWLRDAAPSIALRKWFNHDPAKWSEFQRRYRGELDENPAAWQPILEAAKRGTVTLLFSARDEVHNNAVALQAHLEGQKNRPVMAWAVSAIRKPGVGIRIHHYRFFVAGATKFRMGPRCIPKLSVVFNSKAGNRPGF